MASGATLLGIALMLSANTNNARKEVSDFSRFMTGKMKEMYQSGQKMIDAGKDLRKSGLDDIKTGVAAIAPVVGMVKEAMNFEDAMADVAKVANLDRASAQFKGLSNDALELSKHLATNADDVGKLYASLLAGGTAQENLKEVAKIAGESAVAFDISQEAAGNAFMTMQNAMGLSVKETQRAFDATNAITNKFGGKASEIFDFMVQGGASVARTLGSTAPQMEAFGRALMKSGISSSEAGTIMQRFQLGLYNNAEALKVFKKAGGGSEGIAAVFELAKKSGDPFKWFKEHKFGQYSSQMSLLAKNMGSVQEMLQFVGDETNFVGSANQEFANRTTTTSFKLNQLKQEFLAAAISAGNSLLPAIQSTVESLMPLIKAFGDFVSQNPEVVKAILLGITAFGGFKMASGLVKISVGTIMETWGTLSKGVSVVGTAMKAVGAVLMANPIILIIAAIAGAAYLIYRNWDKLKPYFTAVWNVVKTIFLASFNVIKFLFLNFTPVGLVIKHWDKLKPYFIALWAVIKAIFSPAINALKSIISGLWSFVKSIFTPMLNFIKGLGGLFFNAGKNIVNSIWEGIKALAYKPEEAIKSVVTKIRAFLPFSPAKIGPLKDLHKIRLVETMAQAIRPTAAVSAMRNVAGGIANLRGTQQLAVAGRGGSYSPTFSVTVHLSGSATQADANLITDTAKRKFDAMMKDYNARQQRIKF